MNIYRAAPGYCGSSVGGVQQVQQDSSVHPGGRQIFRWQRAGAQQWHVAVPQSQHQDIFKFGCAISSELPNLDHNCQPEQDLKLTKYCICQICRVASTTQNTFKLEKVALLSMTKSSPVVNDHPSTNFRLSNLPLCQLCQPHLDIAFTSRPVIWFNFCYELICLCIIQDY